MTQVAFDAVAVAVNHILVQQEFGLGETIQRDSNVQAENVWSVKFAGTITTAFDTVRVAGFIKTVTTENVNMLENMSDLGGKTAAANDSCLGKCYNLKGRSYIQKYLKWSYMLERKS